MNTIDSSAATTSLSESAGADTGTDQMDPADVAALKALVSSSQSAASSAQSQNSLESGADDDATEPTTGDGTEVPPEGSGNIYIMMMKLNQPEDEEGRERSPMTYSFAYMLPNGPGGAAVLLPPASKQPTADVAPSTSDAQALLQGISASSLPVEETAPLPVADTDAPATLGSSILDTFFAQSTAAIPAPVVADAGPTTSARVERIEEMINAVADRVMVTDPLSGQNKEVRIKFQDHILPGTEARVWREGGRVMVEFHSTRAESIQWLESTALALSQRLDDRVQQSAPSLVTVNSSGDAPADGRSRERHTPWQQAQQQQEEVVA